uniref:RING-type E3 ubiquitin transferase n=1 Tax=Gasterosteus aculeatus aculeatus TaxID=481459 RepID=A0AAQ4QT87_GASAC
ACVCFSGMFASCCNWLCLDSAADVEPAGGAERRHQSYTNSAFSSARLSPHQHVCVDCQKDYCCRCSAQLEPRPRLCHTCQRFYGNLLERAELMKLKVKELRDYLHLHEVSTHLCREKEELVELVLGQRSLPSHGSVPETPTSTPPDVTSDPTICISSPTPDSPTSIPEPPSAEAPPPPTEDSSGHYSVFCLSGSELGSGGGPVSGRRASLSDLSCPDDIEGLSVRQLKEILARNFVNYKGCCEKWELMERVNRLYQDQQNLLGKYQDHSGPLQDLSGTKLFPHHTNLCKICMDCPIDCVLLECGHMITCTKCGKRMSECPICRQYVVRAVHVFRS